MHTYIFKTYIDGGREYYEYTDAADRERTIKKDFPFPESLMSLLYMDIWELEPITKRMDRALLAFYQSRDYNELQIVAAGLKELAPRHICFELLRLDWLERLDMVDSTAPGDFQDLLPHKKISHLCSSIDTMQKQIKGLIAQVLDMDGEKKPVSEKMVAYYNTEGGDTLNTFRFQPQTMSFEVIDHKVFAEVLYPRDIYDLIDFYVRECVKREVRMRVCKNCLRYFVVTGKASTEYCGRICDSGVCVAANVQSGKRIILFIKPPVFETLWDFSVSAGTAAGHSMRWPAAVGIF